jgi:hypothetical protein
MALVDHPDRAHDLSLVGLVLVIVAIVAAAALCSKVTVDQLFLLFW